MRQLREWLARAALWQVWVYFFVAWTLLHLIISGARTPVGAVLGGLFFASVMTAFTARRRRGDSRAAGRTTSPTEVRQLDRAIDGGRVPVDPADRTALRGLADRRIRQASLYLWFGTVVWLGFLALSVFLFVATHNLASIGEAALFLFFFVWGTVVMRRQRARARSVKLLLDAQQPNPAHGATTAVE
ncbi:MAG: hypothetical protein JWL79_3851 [Frankiales bacterium]|nr:hypothetical protein [Frankiales bacterium]